MLSHQQSKHRDRLSAAAAMALMYFSSGPALSAQLMPAVSFHATVSHYR